jgi:ribosomal protein S18 acetylase RimI-like enzyme
MTSSAPSSDHQADVRVVTCTRHELEALQAAMPSQHHEARYGVQLAGQGLYLIALAGGRIAGRALLRWHSTDATLRQWGIVEPYVEAVGVEPSLRSRGIGTALMRAAEEAAWRLGYRGIGLAVGVENTRARALYERLGYEDAGRPPFDVRWTYRDDDGVERWASETCVYLTKRLAEPEGSGP